MKNQASSRQAGTAAGESRRPVPPLLAMTLQAARRRGDDFADGPEALAQMKRDVLDTPAELLPDLLQALTAVRAPISLQPSTNTKEPNP